MLIAVLNATQLSPNILVRWGLQTNMRDAGMEPAHGAANTSSAHAAPDPPTQASPRPPHPKPSPGNQTRSQNRPQAPALNRPPAPPIMDHRNWLGRNARRCQRRRRRVRRQCGHCPPTPRWRRRRLDGTLRPRWGRTAATVSNNGLSKIIPDTSGTSTVKAIVGACQSIWRPQWT